MTTSGRRSRAPAAVIGPLSRGAGVREPPGGIDHEQAVGLERVPPSSSGVSSRARRVNGGAAGRVGAVTPARLAGEIDRELAGLAAMRHTPRASVHGPTLLDGEGVVDGRGDQGGVMGGVSFGHVDDQTGRRRTRFPPAMPSRAASAGVRRKSRGPRGNGHRPVRGRECAKVVDQSGARPALGQAPRGRGRFGRIGLAIDEGDEGRQVVGLVLRARSATEQLHPVLEQAAQGEAAAMDARLDRAQRHAGHLGDLGVVVALDVEQDDGRPLVVGDLGQRRVERARAFGQDRGPLRVGLVAGRRLPALVLELGVGLDRPALRARWASIAALTQIRLSHDLTLPPRNACRLR